jgi:hypothetical protein
MDTSVTSGQLRPQNSTTRSQVLAPIGLEILDLDSDRFEAGGRNHFFSEIILENEIWESPFSK